MSNELSMLLARLGIDLQSWLGFIDETVVSVAILAFGFSLLLYLSVTFLFWRRGAPWTTAQLFEYVFLSSFGSMYVAACFAALVALLWPAMQLFGFPSEIQASFVSFLKFNYVTVGGVAAVLLLILVLLIWDNKAAQPRLGPVIANALDIWWAAEAWCLTEKQNQFWKLVNDRNTTLEQIEQMLRSADDIMLTVIAKDALRKRFPGWHTASQEGNKMAHTRGDLQPARLKPDPPRPRSRVSEGFHRLGILVGAVLGLGAAALVVLQGGAVWGIGIGVLLFLVAYGFFRLLGWIVNGFSAAR